VQAGEPLPATRDAALSDLASLVDNPPLLARAAGNLDTYELEEAYKKEIISIARRFSLACTAMLGLLFVLSDAPVEDGGWLIAYFLYPLALRFGDYSLVLCAIITLGFQCCIMLMFYACIVYLYPFELTYALIFNPNYSLCHIFALLSTFLLGWAYWKLNSQHILVKIANDEQNNPSLFGGVSFVDLLLGAAIPFVVSFFVGVVKEVRTGKEESRDVERIRKAPFRYGGPICGILMGLLLGSLAMFDEFPPDFEKYVLTTARQEVGQEYNLYIDAMRREDGKLKRAYVWAYSGTDVKKLVVYPKK
jgi:hypothetical protein